MITAEEALNRMRTLVNLWSENCPPDHEAIKLLSQIVDCYDGPETCKDCPEATGGVCRKHQEPECTCYEAGPGHMPGCAFNRRSEPTISRELGNQLCDLAYARIREAMGGHEPYAPAVGDLVGWLTRVVVPVVQRDMAPIRAAVTAVLAFDWAGNDRDAVQAIESLRKAAEKMGWPR